MLKRLIYSAPLPGKLCPRVVCIISLRVHQEFAARCEAWSRRITQPTLFGLQVALVRVVGLDLGTTLIVTGVYNIASGLLFGIPMPVQPMKAIAAIALADQQMRLTHVIAAGVFVSGVTFFLGVTRLITVFNRWSPSPNVLLNTLLDGEVAGETIVMKMRM